MEQLTMLKNSFISSSKFPKALAFCLCLIIILQAGIYIIFIENDPDMKALDKLLHRNSKNVDYLFLGDSRIRSNINEEKLNEIKNLEFVNFGMGGAYSVPQYFILKRFVKNNPGMKIRHCILGVDKQHLIDIYSSRPRENYLTNVLRFHEFREIEKYLPETQIKAYYLSKIFPSYSTPNNFIVYTVHSDRVFKYPGYEARMNRYGNITSEHLAFKELSELNMKYTEKIIEFCISNDIHIQLLINPIPQSIYEEHQTVNPNGFNEMNDFINHLCKKYQVELIQLPRVLPDDNFQDSSYHPHPSHLSRKGSIYYTELLVEKKYKINNEVHNKAGRP